MTVSPITKNATHTTHAYMAPSVPKFAYFGTGEEPKDLTDEDLYGEVFECGVPLIRLMSLQARAWQHGSPFGALAKGLGIGACDAPKTSVLTGIGSNPAPLNLMFCLVGRSGLGKGLTLGAKMVVADPMGGYRKVTPASGEALISKFFDTVPSADGKGMETARHFEPVWAEWGEIDQLVAKSSSPRNAKGGGSRTTLDAVLRSLFTGEDAGDSSISREKAGVGTRVEAGTYRFVMFVGGQPDRVAGSVGADETGGTLQRLIFVDLIDPEAPVTKTAIHALRLDMYASLGVVPADPRVEPTLSVWGPRAGVTLSDDIETLLVEHRAQVLTGSALIDPLDTHEHNNLVRLAAIFAGWRAGLGNPAVIDREAWWWARCYMTMSRRAREGTSEVGAAARRRESREAGKADAERFTAREEALAQARADRIRGLLKPLMEYVVEYAAAGRYPTARDLKIRVTAGSRDLVSDALAILVMQGDLVEIRDGITTRYAPSPSYKP